MEKWASVVVRCVKDVASFLLNGDCSCVGSRVGRLPAMNRERVEMVFWIVLFVCHYLFLIGFLRKSRSRIVRLLPRPAFTLREVFAVFQRRETTERTILDPAKSTSGINPLFSSSRMIILLLDSTLCRSVSTTTSGVSGSS